MATNTNSKEISDFYEKVKTTEKINSKENKWWHFYSDDDRCTQIIHVKS